LAGLIALAGCASNSGSDSMPGMDHGQPTASGFLPSLISVLAMATAPS
jgi:hypothetical protein